MNRCPCGDVADRANVDLNDFQCEGCWRAWSYWHHANPEQPFDAWPGR